MSETPPHNDAPPVETPPPAPVDPPPAVSDHPDNSEVTAQLKTLTEAVSKLIARDEGPADVSPAKVPWIFRGRH